MPSKTSPRLCWKFSSSEYNRLEHSLVLKSFCGYTPACVVEFTARPAIDSNILHTVSASEVQPPASRRACTARRGVASRKAWRRPGLAAPAARASRHGLRRAAVSDPAKSSRPGPRNTPKTGTRPCSTSGACSCCVYARVKKPKKRSAPFAGRNTAGGLAAKLASERGYYEGNNFVHIAPPAWALARASIMRSR